jgi:hypothetical protein
MDQKLNYVLYFFINCEENDQKIILKNQIYDFIDSEKLTFFEIKNCLNNWFNNSKNQLKEKILFALTNTEIWKLGKKAHERASCLFHPKEVAYQTYNYYKDLCLNR